jgi:hypothetical protein
MNRILPLLLLSGITLSCATYGYYDSNYQATIYVDQHGVAKSNGETRHVDSPVLDISEVEAATIEQLPEVVGHIRIEKLFIHPFFVSSPTRQRNVLQKAALKEAEARYGCGIDLVALDERDPSEQNRSWEFCRREMGLANIEYDSEWHILSLLLGFSTIGWLERASLEAVVLREPSTREILPSHMLNPTPGQPVLFTLSVMSMLFQMNFF